MRRLVVGALLVVLVGCGIGLYVVVAQPQWFERLRYPLRYSEYVRVHARENSLDPALLAAVIYQESKFDARAESASGAIGLMQLTPATSARLRVNDAYDSIQNIRGGAKQLRHLLTLYQGDLPLALAAYNAGVHRIKGGKAPRIRETRSYVKKVLRYYEAFRSHPKPSSKHEKT